MTDQTTPPNPPDLPARLTQAIARARWALVWERVWPHLARIAGVAGLFLAASWAGLWLMLPPGGRIAGLFLFAIVLLTALFPAVRLRWPSRSDALNRLDRNAGLSHRPATALADTVRSSDPFTLALWQAQRERMLAGLSRIRAGRPAPRLVLHDSFAVRALVLLLVVTTGFAAGSERRARIAAAFDWGGVLAPVDVRLDAWVTPPLYTGRPPIILTARDAAANAPATLPVPAGSILTIRTSAASLDVALTGAVTEAPPPETPAKADKPAAGKTTADKNAAERHFTIAGNGTAQVRAPAARPAWSFVATPDRAPSIALAKDPERQARGALQLAYKLDDDYGVTEAQATFAAKPAPGRAATKPLFQPPSFALTLPNARTRAGVGQTVKDLSEDPYAGADVLLTLTAKDEAGNEGRSEPVATKLPERLFTKPLPRALIEQRRILALDAGLRGDVMAALDALMVAPELFTPEAGHYLGLRSIAHDLDRARSDDNLREVVANLWSLAVAIEDGDISDVEKALRAAQEALKQALDRGATDEEIKQLTDNLRAALDNFLRQLAEQMKQNPQQLARPLDPNSRVMRQQDLNAMIQRMERLSRQGDKDGAKALLDQLQQMLENLQMARPGQSGDSDGQQALNELGDMIRKQQQLRDKTYKQGQDGRRERRSGKQDGGLGDLQQDQQALRDRLKKLQDDLAQRGLGQTPGQRGQKGQQPGQQGQGGQPGQGQPGQGSQGGDGDDDGDGLGDADNAMGDAGGRLGEGNAESAVDAQGRALDALRKGAQKLAQQMQPGDGDGEDGDPNGPGERAGRQQGSARNSDPLGRPLKGRDLGDDLTVKIPGEIDVQRVRRILEELRRRLGDTTRPQIELDYIERLLKDY